MLTIDLQTIAAVPQGAARLRAGLPRIRQSRWVLLSAAMPLRSHFEASTTPKALRDRSLKLCSQLREDAPSKTSQMKFPKEKMKVGQTSHRHSRMPVAFVVAAARSLSCCSQHLVVIALHSLRATSATRARQGQQSLACSAHEHARVGVHVFGRPRQVNQRCKWDPLEPQLSVATVRVPCSSCRATYVQVVICLIVELEHVYMCVAARLPHWSQHAHAMLHSLSRRIRERAPCLLPHLPTRGVVWHVVVAVLLLATEQPKPCQASTPLAHEQCKQAARFCAYRDHKGCLVLCVRVWV